MPAPPTALVDALRAGTAQRHLFFRLAHSQGTVLVWDGVGDWSYNGETYTGKPGLLELGGVSDSGDVQNHEVVVTLNGVELSSLLNVDTDIRGDAATITALWLGEAGTVVASRTVFSGEGDCLRIKMDAERKSVIAKLRTPLAEWGVPPRAHWTDADQQRRYPGDSGFKMVKLLENLSVSGWSKDAESSGAIPRLASISGCWDSVTGDPIGDALYGLSPNGYDVYVKTYGGGLAYKEQTSGALITFSTADLSLQAGGANCYVDLAGDARTPGGLRVLANGVAGNYLRKQTAISGNGSATGTRVAQSGSLPIKEGGALGADDRSGLVYCNRNGALTAVSGSSVTINGTTCVEETTGAAVAYAGGFLQCAGVDCNVSTTGVVLTTGGRRVVRSGGTASEFLRVWT
jgi:hypothetical protein